MIYSHGCRCSFRLNEHARHIFNGKQGIEIGDEEWEPVEFDANEE